MKVLLVNGSPHEDGCINFALEQIEDILNKEEIETEKIWIGNKKITGCIGCNYCLKNDNKCFINDEVNIFIEKSKQAQGFIIGSPVHFASASGVLTSFLDRVFYGRGNIFAGKAYASVISCRRGGATSTFDQLNKYALISNMYVVRKFILESNTWNKKRRSNARFRRSSNNEKFRKKYGIFIKKYRKIKFK